MKLGHINIVLIIGIITYLFISNLTGDQKPANYYAITAELFQEFDFQKELNAEYLAIEKQQQQELDSLESNLLLQKNKLSIADKVSDEAAASFNKKVNDLEVLSARYEKAKVQLASELNKKIWDKLNALIKKFGAENNMKLILGADGNGNVLFAEDKLNITKELIDYCNMSYNGN